MASLMDILERLDGLVSRLKANNMSCMYHTSMHVNYFFTFLLLK